MPEDDWKETWREKSLMGRSIGEAYVQLIEPILSPKGEKIEIPEWYVLVQHWTHRPNVAAQFHQILDWCRDNEVDPNESEVFKRTFMETAAQDIKYLFLEVLKDAPGYYAFLLASKRESTRARVRTSDALGLR